MVDRRLAGPGHRDVEQHALFEPVVAGKDLLQRPLPVVRRDFGQEADLAQLDADHRHLVAAGNPGGAQHGAVAAERDEQLQPATLASASGSSQAEPIQTEQPRASRNAAICSASGALSGFLGWISRPIRRGESGIWIKPALRQAQVAAQPVDELGVADRGLLAGRHLAHQHAVLRQLLLADDQRVLDVRPCPRSSAAT